MNQDDVGYGRGGSECGPGEWTVRYGKMEVGPMDGYLGLTASLWHEIIAEYGEEPRARHASPAN